MTMTHADSPADPADSLSPFSDATRRWFRDAFAQPTRAQALGWPAIAGGGHVLLHAPTGSGKTLAAFLWTLDRLFAAREPRTGGCVSCTSRR